MPDPFRQFYQQNPPVLSPITDLSHRHFRLLLPRGTFLKVPVRICSPAALQRRLIRYRPSDVYYSTSCWLVPENLGRRERTPLANNIFLSSDIVFDIDRSPFSLENLECAREDTKQLVAFCHHNGLPIKYVAFSGSKGFHVVCDDTHRYQDPHPRAREDMAKEVRKGIISQVQAVGITVDARITTDTRRILRVPGTVNSKTGYVCTLLSMEQLEAPVAEILKYIPRVMVCTPLIPATGDDRPLRGSRIISWLCHRLGVRSKPPTRFSYASYLSNAVPGMALQIPFFTYPPRRNLQKIETELVRLQSQYNLSDIYLYRSETEISAVCLRTLQLRRLEKIIAASSSTNYGTILKYHQLFFRVGKIQDADGRVLAGPPLFEKVITAPEKNNGHFISLPHYHFFSEFLPRLDPYQRVHGNGEVTLTHTVIENGA
jgi:DNA primase catalytic subunit